MEHILNGSSPPAINALCIITNHSYVTILRDKHFQKFILSLISILEFIDKNVGKPFFVFLMYLGIFSKQFTGFKKKVFKVHSIIFFKTFLVFYIYFSDLLIRSEEHTSELQSLRHLVCR